MTRPAATATLGADTFEAMETYVKDYKDAHFAARKLPVPHVDQVDHIILTGMGGSGIGANLVEGLAQRESPRPILVVKNYNLPKWVGKRSLVIATSYSGNTEETLHCVAQARERGASLAGIASGGALAAFLEKNKLPFHKAQQARQPRAALPTLFGALGGMLERAGAGSFVLDDEDERHLQNVHVQLQPKLAGTEDRALRLAGAIHSKQPTIVGASHLWPVATRWKQQFNENSKMFSRAERIPESNHNDLVPWAEAPKVKTDALVFLRRNNEPSEIATRFEFWSEVAKKAKVTQETVMSSARTPLGQCLEHLMVGDYTSVYAAVLRRVDPTPVPIIGDLKKRLERDGLAASVRKKLGVA